MGIRTAVAARDPHAAARSAVLILGVSALVVTGLTLFQPTSGHLLAAIAPWTAVALVLAAALACRILPAQRLDRSGLLVMFAVVGVLLVCLLNVVTEDRSAAAQAFLAFPVLWSAHHLRRGATALVTTTAVLADGAVLLVLLPADEALIDLGFFGAVLVVMAVMLVRAGETQDLLVRALEAQATVDALTGLVNRRAFDDALEATLTTSARDGTALVLIDVDAFKTINDSYGHPVGDDVLIHLASVLRAQVRAEDAVLSRLGGDELAVLLPGTAPEVAARRAEDLLEAVRSSPLLLPDGTLLSLSISVGVAHVAHRVGDLRALYSAADSALYNAKRAGRGRVTVAAG